MNATSGYEHAPIRARFADYISVEDRTALAEVGVLDWDQLDAVAAKTVERIASNVADFVPLFLTNDTKPWFRYNKECRVVSVEVSLHAVRPPES